MKRFLMSLICFSGVVLAGGCSSPPVVPVEDPSAALTYMEAGLRPEELLFPAYLLSEDFELDQHGRIPDSNLIGAGLKTELGLSRVRSRFSEILASNGWKTGKMEMGRNSFRLLATKDGEKLEIRGVQGIGLSRVFILYTLLTPGDLIWI